MNIIQDTEEWSEFRLKGVGASEVAAVNGICPYQTPYDIWLIKTKRKKGFAGNSATDHGKETESKARARYELKTMEEMAPACAVHPKYEMCRASLDGIRSDGELILEIKCPQRMGKTIEAVLAGEVPAHYMAQVQYQLAVTGAKKAHFFVYREETLEEPAIDVLIEVEPDIKFQGEIIAKVLDFWEKYVLADAPPPLTERDVKVIADDEQIDGLCKILLTVKDRVSKKDFDQMKADIVSLSGHPKMRCGDVQLSTVNRNGKFSFHKLTIVKPEAP